MALHAAAPPHRRCVPFSPALDDADEAIVGYNDQLGHTVTPWRLATRTRMLPWPVRRRMEPAPSPRTASRRVRRGSRRPLMAGSLSMTPAEVCASRRAETPGGRERSIGPLPDNSA